MVAELIQPDSKQPVVPMFGSGSPEQPGESSGSRGPPEKSTPERSNTAESSIPGRQVPGVSVLGSPRANGPSERQDVGTDPLGQGRHEQARSTSPQVLAQDEKILSKYFTRGSQGVGEEERANVLREMERGNLEPVNQTDHKEKWSGQDSALPPLPQVANDDKGQ
eukprot:5514129-Amphidinium_carterae.1